MKKNVLMREGTGLIKRVLLALLALALLLGAVGCGRTPGTVDPPPVGPVGPVDPVDPEPPKDDYAARFARVDETDLEKVRKEGGFVPDGSVPETAGLFVPAPIVAGGMVLQRNAVNRVWGEASFEGEFAAVFGGKTCYGSAEGGEFLVYLPPMAAAGPSDLVLLTERGKVTIADVSVGEVFLVSGQSNVAWTMENTLTMGKQQLRFGNYIPDKIADPETYAEYYASAQLLQSYKDAAKAEVEANERIRICNLTLAYGGAVGSHREPLTSIPCAWTGAAEESIESCSMFAYYFAKNIQTRFFPEMAVGVVVGAVGGTYAANWVSRETVEETPELFAYGNRDEDTSTGIARCYNTYIAPILRYKFKAAIWYQGEGQITNYAQSIARLIGSWREEMGQPELGFLIVGLPKYAGSAAPGDYSSEEYRELSPRVGLRDKTFYLGREEQRRIPLLAKNCAVSVNINTGDYDDIHPSDKRLIAKQSADKFMEYFYRYDAVLSGPRLCGAERRGNEVVLTFENVGEGLVLQSGGLNFEVAQYGDDYCQTEARLLTENQLALSADGLPIGEINYVRYGALNYPRISRVDMSRYVSVFNAAGYPCNQFELDVEDAIWNGTLPYDS